MALELRSHAPAAPDPPLLAGLRGLGARRAISAQERMLFTERLALLIETGMALHAALDTLRQQTPDGALSAAIGAIQDDVVGGRTLAAALARQPELFPAASVNLIAAAEAGGFVAQALAQILEMEDRQQRLRATIAGALAYPAFLAAFSVAVVLLVLVGVFPRFAELFDSIRNQLPLSTIVLMAASDLLRQHWLPIGAGLAVLAGALVHWLRSAHGKALLDGLKLRLPLAREVFVQVYMIRLMRQMSVSLGNGVSITDTLEASRGAVDNGAFRAFMLRVEERVGQGRGVAAAFREEPFIPLLVRQMIGTGEETGRLALVTGRIADFYERELNRRIALVTRMIEPVMLLVMGLVVGLIVTSLILPIFKLAKAVG